MQENIRQSVGGSPLRKDILAQLPALAKNIQTKHISTPFCVAIEITKMLQEGIIYRIDKASSLTTYPVYSREKKLPKGYAWEAYASVR